eukprot:3247379-Amphidinium_carterae.1
MPSTSSYNQAISRHYNTLSGLITEMFWGIITSIDTVVFIMPLFHNIKQSRSKMMWTIFDFFENSVMCVMFD